MKGAVEGTALDIARSPDSEDVGRARKAAREAWKTVG
jgi:hypothetical protein